MIRSPSQVAENSHELSLGIANLGEVINDESSDYRLAVELQYGD